MHMKLGRSAPKTVKFWSRICREKSVEWVLVDGLDDSRVPLTAWKAFNKAFWCWKTDGVLYPLDELDAYQVAVATMVRVAERLPKLSRASASTYLVSVAYKSLLKHKERVVDPTRETYREMFDSCRVPQDDPQEVRSEDKEDREWGGRDTSALDVQAFVASLSGTHSVDGVHAASLAAACVYETLAKLDEDAQAGLRAWLKADGIWVDAARHYDSTGSVQSYVYRFWHVWRKSFCAACDWIW